jgi:hypothetical protein
MVQYGHAPLGGLAVAGSWLLYNTNLCVMRDGRQLLGVWLWRAVQACTVCVVVHCV